MYGAGDVRIADVPDPAIHAPTDAIVRVVRAAICGSDLHPYRSMPTTDQGRQMGHEFLGIIEDTGAEVTGLKCGDLVLSPFTGRVFDRTVGLAGVPDGYRAMADRQSLKVLIAP